MRPRNHSASNIKPQTHTKLLAKYREYVRHLDPLLSLNDNELDEFMLDWEPAITGKKFDLSSLDDSLGRVDREGSRRSSFSLKNIRQSIRSSHETAAQIFQCLKSISEHDVALAHKNEEYGLIEAFGIYGMKKATLTDILQGAQTLKNSQEILKKLCKNNLQSKVEVLESWFEAGDNDNLKRSLEDYRDMVFQNDLSLKALIAEDQCYEYSRRLPV